MILIDSNIPMYLVGPHAGHKATAQGLLEQLLAAGERLVTVRRADATGCRIDATGSARRRSLVLAWAAIG